MFTFKRSSIGYLSSLFLIGASTALAGCSGDGSDAGTAPGASDDTNGAGTTSTGSGGSSANGSGGAGAKAGTGGSSSTSTGGSKSTGGSSNASTGGSTASGGSTATGGSAGTKNDAGNAGTAGTGTSGSAGTSGSGGSAGVADSPDDENADYSIEAFGHAEPTGPEHPLTQVETKIMRRDEVSWYAPAPSGSVAVTLDDAGHDYQMLAGSSVASLLDGLTIFETTSANVDDDGNDELIAVGLVGTAAVARIVDSDASGVFRSVKEIKLDDQSYKHVRVRTADVDQDGRDEILLLAVTSTGRVVARLYDDALANYAFVKQIYEGAGEEIAAAFGNFDGDRAPELALLIDGGSKLTLEIRDDADAAFAVLKSFEDKATGLIRGQGLVVGGLRLEAGNFDADSADELMAFAEGYDTDTENGSSGLYMRGFDDADTDFAQLANTQRDLKDPQPNSNYRYTQNWGWQTLVADSNGDGQDEVFVLARYAGDQGDDIKLFRETFGDEIAKWTTGEQVLTLTTGVAYPNAISMAAASGRTDSLGADVIVAVRDGAKLTPYRVRAGTSNEKYVSASTPLTAQTITSASQPVWATSGDFDADSLRLRYTGQKWLELSRPQPIIVVATPPLKDGISQNYDNSGSAYGTAATHTTEITEEHSFTEKVTMSFELTVPVLDFLSASAHAELSRQFTDTNTKTETTSTSISYGSTYPEDIVVFRGTLCTRYEYVVVGGNEHDLIGTKMTIDVPLDNNTYKWTVPYYNESLGTQGSPIDAKLLHTAGDPTSYPTLKQRDALHPLWKAPKATPVGQGSSTTETTIDLSSEQTNGTSYTTSSEYGGEVGMFVSAGYSQGWDDTSAYSITTGKETHFIGTVGDIKNKQDYTHYLYNYGLFVYETQLAGGETVQVLDYWTETLGDGYTK